MAKNPSFADEARWFDKMHQASSGVYKLAHAVRLNAAQPFRPKAIYGLIQKSAETHLNAHVAAVSMFTARAAGDRPKTARAAKRSVK